MKITNVRVNEVSGREDSRLLAVASIVIDDEIAIHGIKIINGEKGIFVAMPSKRTPDGFSDIAHPINSTAREIIHKAVLNEYNNLSTNNS